MIAPRAVKLVGRKAAGSRVAEVGALDRCIGQVGAGQYGALEDGAGEVLGMEVPVGQVVVRETDAGETFGGVFVARGAIELLLGKAAADPGSVAEIRPVHRGVGQRGAGQIRGGEIGVREGLSGEIPVGEVISGQDNAAEILSACNAVAFRGIELLFREGAAGRGTVTEIRPGDRGARQVGARQVGRPESRAGEVCVGQATTGQVRRIKGSVRKVLSREVPVRQIIPFQSDAREVLCHVARGALELRQRQS